MSNNAHQVFEISDGSPTESSYGSSMDISDDSPMEISDDSSIELILSKETKKKKARQSNLTASGKKLGNIVKNRNERTQRRNLGQKRTLQKNDSRKSPKYCDHCKTFGHKTQQCTSKCHKCGQLGHQQPACPLLAAINKYAEERMGPMPEFHGLPIAFPMTAEQENQGQAIYPTMSSLSSDLAYSPYTRPTFNEGWDSGAAQMRTENPWGIPSYYRATSTVLGSEKPQKPVKPANQSALWYTQEAAGMPPPSPSPPMPPPPAPLSPPLPVPLLVSSALAPEAIMVGQASLVEEYNKRIKVLDEDEVLFHRNSLKAEDSAMEKQLKLDFSRLKLSQFWYRGVREMDSINKTVGNLSKEVNKAELQHLELKKGVFKTRQFRIRLQSHVKRIVDGLVPANTQMPMFDKVDLQNRKQKKKMLDMVEWEEWGSKTAGAEDGETG